MVRSAYWGDSRYPGNSHVFTELDEIGSGGHIETGLLETIHSPRRAPAVRVQGRYRGNTLDGWALLHIYEGGSVVAPRYHPLLA